MLNLSYFKDCGPLIKAAWRFSDNLVRCVGCGEISIKSYFDSNNNKLSSSDAGLLEETCNELNNLNLCIDQLWALEICLTGGMCAPCVRQKMLILVRKRQEKEGLFPCFGTAVDGHCSQQSCRYYSCCVIDRNTLKEWEKRRIRTCSDCSLKEYFQCS